MSGSDSNSSRPPTLPPNAMQLLQKVAEMRKETYRDSYEITSDLLEKLGFPSEEVLQEAVDSLFPLAHDERWDDDYPVISIETDSMLASPHCEAAWSKYRAWVEFERTCNGNA